jgi:hypothetical protein
MILVSHPASIPPSMRPVMPLIDKGTTDRQAPRDGALIPPSALEEFLFLGGAA